MTLSQPFSSLSLPELYQALETSPSGLREDEINARLNLYGPNILADLPPPPLWRRLIGYFTHPMALLLWLSGVVLLISRHTYLAALIWFVVLFNGSLSFWREYQARKAVKALSKFLPVYARVTRKGQERSVPVQDLVPGDVLILSEGDNIPADARVVEDFGLRVNNSTLTGEAVPVRKTSDPSQRDDLSEIEQPNLVFAGTSVVAGTGRAVVYATAMQTQFGRIANLTHTVKDEPSLLQGEMKLLSRRISIAGLILGAIVFISAMTDVKMPLVQSLVMAAGIIVAMIPEGLVPTLTLILAMGVQRLAKEGVLVKQLSKLETLGTISVICTDKSGTLTQNQMTVRKLWVDGQTMDVSGTGYNPEGDIRDHRGAKINHQNNSSLGDLLTAAFLCNNSRLNPPRPEDPRWSFLGDQTEAALLVLAKKGQVDDQAGAYLRVHELPFDARRKRMSTIYTSHGQKIAFVKGAPKEVLALCETILIHGNETPLTDDLRADILAANDRFARQTLRVLALARRSLPEKSGAYHPDNVETGLVFLGLAGMMDPPRPEVAKAVEAFRSAGIRMVMITGDYGLTAASLARRIGMITGPSPKIITGADLDDCSDDQLVALLKEEAIFARMAPDHKLRLVAAFQSRGEVVAVIGDGVNDAPALRKADIGIAMGRGGTDVAREAADVVLTNDNFELIIRAIEEGRAVYQNLRKFITYIFASNVPEVLPFILTALFKIPLALNVVQILAIDLGTDLLPALALGLERPEPDIMEHPPRKRSQPLIDRGLVMRSFTWLGLIEAALCYLGFFIVLSGAPGGNMIYNPIVQFLFGPSGGPVNPAIRAMLATTVFHAGVVTAQIGNAFACRSEKGNVRWLGLLSNPTLIAGILIECLLILIMIYIQPIAVEFGHTALPAQDWVWLALFAPFLYLLERLRKTLVRKIARNNSGGKP